MQLDFKKVIDRTDIRAAYQHFGSEFSTFDLKSFRFQTCKEKVISFLGKAIASALRKVNLCPVFIRSKEGEIRNHQKLASYLRKWHFNFPFSRGEEFEGLEFGAEFFNRGLPVRTRFISLSNAEVDQDSDSDFFCFFSLSVSFISIDLDLS